MNERIRDRINEEHDEEEHSRMEAARADATVDTQQPADEMGQTSESLLAWMREVAIARDDFKGKHRTVNLKFTTNTLRMWVSRVDDAIGSLDSPSPYNDLRETLRWTLEQLNDGITDSPPPHPCEFTDNPERGECRFCKKWVEAMDAAGIDYGEELDESICPTCGAGQTKLPILDIICPNAWHAP